MKKLQDNCYELTDEEIKILETKKTSVWRPENDEKYWYVDGEGDVVSSIWYNDRDDCFRLSRSVFPTKEEAEKHAQHLHALGRIRMYCLENWPFELDWKNNTQEKHGIGYNHNSNTFDTYRDNTTHWLDFIPVLPSKEAAKDVIKNCEADLKIVLGVE
jgi:hypothetical protein